MPYDPAHVQPMRDELVEMGVRELRTAEDVETFLTNHRGTALLVVNSVCGCAAGLARPGVKLALGHTVKPVQSGSLHQHDRGGVQHRRT